MVSTEILGAKEIFLRAWVKGILYSLLKFPMRIMHAHVPNCAYHVCLIRVYN